jgi:hypothetical protein
MQRDNFYCQICCDKNSTLNVHHLKYEGNEPWDIDNSFLITLCESCHKEEHEIFKENAKYLIDILKSKGFTSSQIGSLCFTISSLPYGFGKIEPNFSILENAIKNHWELISDLYWNKD